MLSSLFNDVRLAARSLARSPGFTVATIVTIALGVGVNTGIFSIVNGALFRDIPAPDAHELVSMDQSIEGAPDRTGAVGLGLFSTAEYQAYRERSQTLSIMGHSAPASAMLGGESPRQTNGLLVTCGYFDVLEQPPAIGRGLVERDCASGADPVVVLGHELWTTAFAADPSVVGRTIELNRQLFTVAGVAPRGVYGGMFRAGFFAPVAAQRFLAPEANEFESDQASWLFLLGRRNDGVSLDEARAELDVIAAQIDSQEPGRSTALRVERAKPLTVPPFVRGAAMGAGAVVMAAFGLILADSVRERRESPARARHDEGQRDRRAPVARREPRARRSRAARRKRAALDRGRRARLRAGALVVRGAARRRAADDLARRAADARARREPRRPRAVPTLALTFGTGLLFGLAPALQVSKPDLSSVMKQDSSGIGGRRGGRLQAALVGAQVALCMLLMAGAGLLLRGLYSAHSVDPGFAYRDVSVLSYDYVDDTGHEGDAAFWQRLRDEIAALPGVDAAAYATREPLGDDSGYTQIRLPSDGESEPRLAAMNGVGPDYFAAVGLSIVSGRAFTRTISTTVRASRSSAKPRRATSGPAAIRSAGRSCSASVAARKRSFKSSASSTTRKSSRSDRSIRTIAYEPVRQAEKLVVRSRLGAAATAAAIRGVVRKLDPSLPVPVYPLEANLARWQAVSGLVAALAAALGGLALVLAAVGIYGVVAYFVSRRFREIGIRVALGAGRASVLGMILRRTLRPVVAGAALGAAAALAASGILTGVLFGVSPLDPAALIGAVLFVLGVALAAASLAARRATHVDPMVTLRYE